MHENDKTIEVYIKSITLEADDVISLDLRPVVGPTLPAFTAGAHIELYLRNGMSRNYSLANSQDECHRYCIGVQKDPNTRGGSRFIHETMHVGDVLSVSSPRNNFILVEDAPQSVLIAGGIGVTPVWCMLQRLADLGRHWEFYYAARSRRRAAFLDGIAALGTDAAHHVHTHFDDESAGSVIDLEAVVRDAAPGTHFYCCGPVPMLEAFERAAAGCPAACVHVEYFAAKAPVEASGGFEVVLSRSGRTVFVPTDSTILDALLAVGIQPNYSCLEGVCGTCETGVLDGIPDHRDVVLSAQERASNSTMMICCSGSKSSRLVLDL